MKKIYKIIMNNWLIVIIMIISLVLHILAIKQLGFNYTLNSDDASYVKSGIVFLQTGEITMHGVISAQIMPGMTFLIAFMALIFGTGTKLMISLKVLWMIMGISTICVVYKTIKLYTNKYISALSCLFFLAIDYVWMDNLILTETPFILLFALLIYHTLKLSQNTNRKDYILIIIYYIMAVFIRPNIGIFPIFLFIFLLLKKYDFKLLMKQCLIAGAILLLCLIPWTYRNYKVFGKFIPLTYGIGNPLLLGTYQGVGYPLDEELDYVKNVDEKIPDKMKYYLENTNEKEYMTKYYLLEYDGMKAKYRMHEWWNKDKISMLKSYLYYKPKELFNNYFYWDTILGIKPMVLSTIRKLEILFFGLSSLLILLNKKRIKEWLFLILTYGSQIALYSYTFAFSRYAISMFFIRYIVIGIGIGILYDIVKNRRKHEDINDNSSI
ncbi:MAG: glycosyltransferase family 39 protein [Bacilli bacterium]|nr:glycosyltransferase family 39 protein [Bacilli bacterium]